MKKKILIFSTSRIYKEPRVIREIEALQDTYDLDVSGTEPSSHKVFFIDLSSYSFRNKFVLKIFRFFLFIFRFYDKFYWDARREKMVKILEGKSYSAVIVHDIFNLPIVIRAFGKKSKIIFNAHEYYPNEFDDQLKWRLIQRPYIRYLCKKYIPQSDLLVTVGEIIAQKYRENFKVPVVLISNACRYYSTNPNYNLQSKTIKIIHHGACLPSRKIETMIEMMNFLDDRFELDLMLVNTENEYGKYLLKLIEKTKNVRMISPVSFEEIVPFCSSYDIGLFLLPPTNFNYKNALPNKLFEFIQSRLAIAIGPTPEMEAIVTKYDLGIVSDDFSPMSLASKVNTLGREKITYYKNQCHQYAYLLSDETNKKNILNVVS